MTTMLRHGAPLYTRIDQPATAAQKAALKKLSPEAVKATTLAGEPILQRLTTSIQSQLCGNLQLNLWLDVSFQSKKLRGAFTNE